MSDYQDLKIGSIRDLKAIINLKAYWRDKRLEYVTNNLIYMGVNYFHDADTSNTDWEIWKYTWDGTDLTRIEGPLPGAWDDRATLSWGA